MQSQDFFQVPYRRDQIEITYKIGFSPPRESKLTHADAAKLFKIERSTFEDQHSRALRGPVSDGAPKRAASIIQRKEGDDDDAKFTNKVRHSMEQMVKYHQLYRKNSSYKFTDEYLAVLKVARGRNV